MVTVQGLNFRWVLLWHRTHEFKWLNFQKFVVNFPLRLPSPRGVQKEDTVGDCSHLAIEPWTLPYISHWDPWGFFMIPPNLIFSSLARYGEGCKFWRAPDETHAETKGQYFVAEKIEYRQRPFRGDVVDVKKGCVGTYIHEKKHEVPFFCEAASVSASETHNATYESSGWSFGCFGKKCVRTVTQWFLQLLL